MAKLPLLVGALAAAVAFGAVMLLSATRDEGQEPVAAAQGLAVFNRMGCGSCHRLAAAHSTGPIGPDLDERLRSQTAQSLKAKILSPGEMSAMPADFGQRLTDEQLDALVGFLLVSRR